jgi:hypothetical protein
MKESLLFGPFSILGPRIAALKAHTAREKHDLDRNARGWMKSSPQYHHKEIRISSHRISSQNLT